MSWKYRVAAAKRAHPCQCALPGWARVSDFRCTKVMNAAWEEVAEQFYGALTYGKVS